MARLNTRRPPGPKTREGAPSVPVRDPLQRLQRSLLSCLLWERSFYEDGEDIATRILSAAKQVSASDLAALASKARHQYHLRHAPMLLLLESIRRGGPEAAQAIAGSIHRADEMGELLSLYWREGKRPLSAQLKKGLAAVFPRFDAYQLAKYDRATAVRLRDVLFLTHPKPKDEAQAAVWKALVDGTLPAPDTWEVGLSAGGDKAETFTRLLLEHRLGYLALLRNLRNMTEAGVHRDLIVEAILARKGAERVLPFRYVAAARACPQMEPALDEALAEAIADLAPLPGLTAVLVDVSGSMAWPLSSKSDMRRIDAGGALASIIPGQCRVFTFSERLVEVPPRRGMAGVAAIWGSQPNSGTWLGKAVTHLNQHVPHDRLIVITDEQSHDTVPAPICPRAYMVNVGTDEAAVGYGTWTRVSGFSENVLRFIGELERGSD